MHYPKTIPLMSETRTWGHSNMFKSGNNQEFTKSYYHRTNSTINMHNHNFYEINIITEGNGRHYIENHNFEATPGTVFVIPPGINHGYYAMRHLCVFHIIVSYTFIEHYARELSSLPGYSLLFEIEPLLRGEYDSNLFLRLSNEDLEKLVPLFNRLCSLEVSDYKGKFVIKNAISLELIGTLSEKISKQIHNPVSLHKNPHSAPVIQSMEYIRNHLNEKISFKKLSEAANMSYSTFLRHFTEICGLSPGQYLSNCRLDKAKEMLIHTNKNVLDIAFECGYYDSSHLIRAYTEKYGMSPLSYRNSLKQP